MKIGEKIMLNGEEHVITAFESGYFTAQKEEKSAKPKKPRVTKPKVSQVAFEE